MKPVQCRLWQNEKITQEDLVLETIKTYGDSLHAWHKLLRCPLCGQLYFYEFYEDKNPDWGSDDIYETYIPVSTVKEADAMRDASPMSLLSYIPQLREDLPNHAQTPIIHWYGRDL